MTGQRKRAGIFERFFASMSMRSKLLTVSLSVTILAIAVASIVVILMGWKNSRSRLGAQVDSLATMLAENSAAALAFSDKDDASKLLSSLRAVSNVEAAAIYTQKGERLAGFSKNHQHAPVQQQQFDNQHYFVNDALVVQKSVMLEGERIGSVYINSNLTEVYVFLQWVLIALGIAIFFAVIVSLGLTAWFQGFVSSPISRLADTARKIKEEQDFSLRMDRETSDEVGILADTMNETLEAMAQSEKNYREIFNGVRDGIFVQDSKSGIIVDVNEAALEMYQIRREELIGFTASKVNSGVSPYDQNGLQQKFKLAIENGPQIFEWKAKRQSGEQFWVEVNLHHMEIGDTERILAVVRDITERKRSQQVLIQTEKMMSTGGLAAGIAHEINNPLAGILQSSEVLLQRLRDKNLSANKKAAKTIGISLDSIEQYMEDRKIIKMLESIHDAGSRAAKIISNMLGFARKGEPTQVPENLSRLVDETIALAATDYNLKKQYDFRQIEIVRQYDESVPSVQCERTKIQQVFFNLLRNGAEAMHEASRKDPRTHARFILRLAHEPKRKMVRVEIEDTGPGMSKEVQGRIFEPFFTTKSAGQGTGLGLSVSYFIITDDHHGEMEVASQEGSGTKFTIRLPIQLRRTSKKESKTP